MTEATATQARRGRPPKARPEREAVRTSANQVVGREGEVLSRTRSGDTDQFQFDRRIIPDGWDYQWNPYTVYGDSQINAQLAMYQNGWRPVPASRHPGLFMPQGYEGQIIRDGLRLEERPMQLTEEARQEEVAKARSLMRGAKESLGLAQKLPPGFTRDNGMLGQMERRQTRSSIAPAPDIPVPSRELAID